jgi:DNA polymerase III epsilon subunit family exonuclease
MNNIISNLIQSYNLKLKEVKYSISSDTCTFYLLFKENVEEPNDNIKNELLSKISKVLNLNQKTIINLDFKKSYLDKYLISKNIISFIKSNFPSIILNEDDSNLIKIDADKVSITLELLEVQRNYIDSIDLNNKILKELNDNFMGNFEISISYINKEVSKEIEKEKEILDSQSIYSVNNNIQTFKVNNIVKILGDDIKGEPQILSSLNGSEKNCIVAGKMTLLTKNSYKRRETDKETNEETEIEKFRYNFSIEDFSGKTSAVIFPNKKIEEICDKIEDNREVILIADADKFRDSISLRVKAMSYCEIPKGLEVKINYKKEFSKYINVEPLDYVDLSQAELFDIMNENNVCEYLKDKDFVVFDLETTGLDFENCEIIEIGAVKVRNGKIIQTFETLIKPKKPIPSDATEINHITNDMVKDCLPYEKIIPDFYKFTRNSIMVAHNAEFDITFTRKFGKICGYNFDNEVVDTLAMSKKLLKGIKNYKLSTICEYLKISLIGAHRAINDTIATAKCFIKLAEMMK